MSPRFFIDRPIFASVLSIVIVVVGLVAMRALPIAQYPDITPPVVQIDADYPGASAEVVANAVARPIEVQLPGIDNLLYFESTSTNDGHMTIKVTFEIGTDIDIAQVQTQNRVKLAEPQIPQEVTRQGVTVKKLSSDLLAVITLSSDDPQYDTLFLSNYATLQILDNIRRVPGIGDATVFGQQNYSMRLILNPDRMAQLQITPTDIVNIVREQNRDFPSGTIGREPALKGTLLTFPVITQGRLTEVKDFEALIIRALPDGSMVRLKDVARVELGAQSYALESRKDKKPTTFILAFLSPGANALDSISQVRQAMGEMSKNFPTGLTTEIPFDTTRFVEVSIREVLKTLGEAMILVVFAVVFLFLHNWRATLIPTLAVPVSLLGTFAGLYLLGFSINTLTLFGMVLSIGIVVDDAIVVLENVERLMREQHLSAARRGDQGDGRGHRPDRRHRPRAVRGLRPDRLPRRADRRVVPPVRDHHLDLGRALRLGRADHHPGAVRADPQTGTQASRIASSVCSTGCSIESATATAPAYRRRNVETVSPLRRDLRRRLVPLDRHVQIHSERLLAGRGPGLLHYRDGLASRRRLLKQRTDEVVAGASGELFPLRSANQDIPMSSPDRISSSAPGVQEQRGDDLRLPLQHWDERSDPRDHVKSLVGDRVR
ncbi:MAG: efflux RND transporter permease subunit [Candidatus Manganitrophus sp.]|nr:MAG: efflux RND transporter permease subunit [Candidatus Manganitrophus sp.]